jgi:hypothetical protein
MILEERQGTCKPQFQVKVLKRLGSNNGWIAIVTIFRDMAAFSLFEPMAPNLSQSVLGAKT